MSTTVQEIMNRNYSWNDGMKNDRKGNTICPRPFHGRGIKNHEVTFPWLYHSAAKNSYLSNYCEFRFGHFKCCLKMRSLDAIIHVVSESKGILTHGQLNKAIYIDHYMKDRFLVV
jgi:hypothetical protein